METEVESESEPKLGINDEFPSLQKEDRNAEVEDEITYICSFMLILCGAVIYKTCDVMRCVWVETVVHALQEVDNKDDLKTDTPGVTPNDMIIDDPGDVVVDTSDYDGSVYKIKSDQEVYNKETVDDPAVEFTGAADDDKEEPVTVNSSSYKKVDTSVYDGSVYKVKTDPEVYNKRTVDDPAVEITRAADGVKEEPVTVNASSYNKDEPMKKTHHASLKIAGHKYDDDAAPNMMMMQQSRTCERNSWTATCIVLANLYPQLSHLNLCVILLVCFAFRNTSKTIYSFDLKKEEDNQDSGPKMVQSANEIKAGDARRCSKCDLEGRNKETLINHSYKSHITPTNTCKDCHTTLKNMHKLEPHKKVYSSGTLKCKISYSYEGLKNQRKKESFRTGNCTNENFFKCDKCEYTSKGTIEPEDHPQDYHCKKYKLNLSHRIDIKSVVKQVSSNNDVKKNNIAFSTNVPATMYSHDFACENCDNPMTDKTHPKELMKYYHKARMKNTEEKPTWLNCGNLCDEETDLRYHITIEHKEGDKSPSFMGIRLTMICCVIETEKNKLGPSWAKLSHKLELIFINQMKYEVRV